MNRRAVLILLISALVSMMRVQASSAQLSNGTPVYFQLGKLASGTSTVQDVCCEKQRPGYWSQPQSEFETSFGRNTYWLKIRNEETNKMLDFGTLVDELTLYVVNPNTGKLLLRQHAGDQIAATKRTVIATRNAFKIPTALAGDRVLVRIVQDNVLSIQPRWVSTSVFSAREVDALVVHALITGSAGIMLIFNLLLGLFLRKFLFFAYAAFVGSLILSNLVISGLGPAYIWPSSSNMTGFLREIGMVGNLLFFGLMILAFLHEPSFGRLKKFGILLPAILALPIGCLWWTLPHWQAHILISLYMMMSTFLLLSVVVYLAYQGVVRAKILLPTLILVIVPTTLALELPKNSPAIWQLNLFSIDYLVVADHLFELVVLLDSLLFSLLIAFQIRMVEDRSVKASQELARLQGSVSRKIIDAVDVERRRIASDLHDTAGQGMLAVSSRLSQLLRKENFTKRQQQEIKRSADYSCGIVGDIRRISHDLHPASIDHLGWHSAIEELVDQLSANTDINCKFEVLVPEATLSDFQELHLYRISQEIISNMAKHSDATEFNAHYALIDDKLVATFNDNGRIKQPEKHRSSGVTLGQMIIDQRVQALDGDWHSQVSDGSTSIVVQFPIQPSKIDERPG